MILNYRSHRKAISNKRGEILWASGYHEQYCIFETNFWRPQWEPRDDLLWAIQMRHHQGYQKILIIFPKTFLASEFEREHEAREMGDQILIINFCSLSPSKKMFDCWGSAQSTSRPMSLKNYLSHFCISIWMTLWLCRGCWLVLKLWRMMMDGGLWMAALGLIWF